MPDYNTLGVKDDRYITRGLFYDLCFAKGDYSRAKYTLHRKDNKGYPSLYRLYMEMEDILEFEFANTYFEDYEHWLRICDSPWFVDHIALWRKELELKIRTRALKALQVQAVSDTKQSAEINKYLLNRGWDLTKTDRNAKGRPSKQEIKNELQRQVEEEKTMQDDLNRVTGLQ